MKKILQALKNKLSLDSYAIKQQKIEELQKFLTAINKFDEKLELLKKHYIEHFRHNPSYHIFNVPDIRLSDLEALELQANNLIKQKLLDKKLFNFPFIIDYKGFVSIVQSYPSGFLISLQNFIDKFWNYKYKLENHIASYGTLSHKRLPRRRKNPSTSSTPHTLLTMCPDTLNIVLKFLPGEALLNLAVTCKLLHGFINRPEVLDHIKDILLITPKNRHLFYSPCVKLGNGDLIYAQTQDNIQYLILHDMKTDKITQKKALPNLCYRLEKLLNGDFICDLSNKKYHLDPKTLTLGPEVKVHWADLTIAYDEDDINQYHHEYYKYPLSPGIVNINFLDKQTMTSHVAELYNTFNVGRIRKLQPNVFMFFPIENEKDFAVWNSETNNTRYYAPTIKGIK
jgi:hypothetical protein